MKHTFAKLLLVTAVIVPAHVYAENYVDQGNTRVIHYTNEQPVYKTAYTTSTTHYYDREGFVANDNTTIIQALQQALRDAGFYKLGDVNGVWTQHTADALYSYQLANGLRGTARLDYPTGQRLGMAMPAMDKVMDGSTRAPRPNDTTRHAYGMAGRRVIQDPPTVVSVDTTPDRHFMHDAKGNRIAYTDYRHMDVTKVQDIQQTLADAGFYKGGVDGAWGPQTTKALGSYQAANGLRVTHHLNSQTLDKMGVVESENDQEPSAGQ